MSQPTTDTTSEPTVSDIVAALRYCDDWIKSYTERNPPRQNRPEQNPIDVENYGKMLKNRAKWMAAFQKATDSPR